MPVWEGMGEEGVSVPSTHACPPSKTGSEQSDGGSMAEAIREHRAGGTPDQPAGGLWWAPKKVVVCHPANNRHGGVRWDFGSRLSYDQDGRNAVKW